MDYFEYKGKIYPYKSVYFQNENMNYIISCEELNSVLLPDSSSYDSEEAKYIDEQIFFFVPKNILNESNEIIERYVKEAL